MGDSMSGGTADFFYREARRLKFVARSAFKVHFCLSVALVTVRPCICIAFQGLFS